MALFDFLKRKEEVKKAKEGKKTEQKPVKKAEKVLDSKKKAEKTATVKPVEKTGKFYYEAVNKPHISEKSGYLAEKNQYTFRVSERFNKNEIRNAIQGLYGVDVLSVNLIKIPSKKRRIGRNEGFKKGYVKAIVKIKKDQKIEIL
jgi:large subunit ribosomal protein L23